MVEAGAFEFAETAKYLDAGGCVQGWEERVAAQRVVGHEGQSVCLLRHASS